MEGSVVVFCTGEGEILEVHLDRPSKDAAGNFLLDSAPRGPGLIALPNIGPELH